MLQDFTQDLRIAFRSLLRAPVLALTIVATVGLGIGATAAIFSAVNATILQPLPYTRAGELVRIYTDSPPFKFRFSVADYNALTEQQTSFSQIANFTDRSMSYSNGDSAELLRARVATWTYFSLLGIQPALGADFTESDGRNGSPFKVLLTDGFWRQRLGGRTNVVGEHITLDGADYTIAGVLPARLGPLEGRQDFFVAAQFAPPRRKGPFFYTTIARLKPGVDPAVATEELHAINRRMFPNWQSSYQDDKATWNMDGLKTFVIGSVETTATLALVAVGLVWLIASTNASNLLIARVTSRRRELAVRAALGASRSRVIRYLLAESSILATASVVVGAALAWAGMGLLRGVGSTYFPRMQEVAFTSPVIAVLAGLTITSALIFGLVPATHGTGGSVGNWLRSVSRSSTADTGASHLRRALVGAQFAIATPLLIVAALLLTSLNELRRVDLGFDGRTVLTGSIRLPGALYTDAGRITNFWNELRTRIEAIPGITAVGFADGRPPATAGQHNNFDLEDFPAGPGQSQPVTAWVGASPEYFHAVGMKLVDGRWLDIRDAQRENLEAVLVDSAWARRFFPGQSALGKRFKEGGCTTCPWTVVVGVVGTIKYDGLNQPDQGTVYWALPLESVSRFVLVRTAGDPAAATESIRQAVRSLDPSVPLASVATIGELVDQTLQRPQSLSFLIGGFALAALLLSVVGIYGVMGYYVQQHTREIGIRLALGGKSSDVLTLVLRQGMTVVVIGVLIGAAAALGLTRFMASLLFGVDAANMPTFAGVSVTMLAVALTACILPAIRAVRVQPAVVLRNE